VFLNIYKVQIFSVKHIQFIVKYTFKATCFGSTEPSSGLFVRRDSYPIASTFRIRSVLTKRPDDGSVELKHIALNVFLTTNWVCLTEKKLALCIYLVFMYGSAVLCTFKQCL